jgi:hypothetical protein
MARYDMNETDGEGVLDLNAMTADEVDATLDALPEAKLDHLFALASDAGAAAEEIELIRKVTVQLVKQAIRAAKKLA